MGTYITATDLYRVYGQENVNEWATIGTADSAEEIAEVINSAIAYAEGVVTARFRNSRYTVPFSFADSGALALLKDCMAIKACSRLYRNHGLQDEDEQGNKVQSNEQRAEKTLNKILTGQLDLGPSYSHNYGNSPFMV